MKELIGTGVALITPFNSDLSIDHQALAAIVEFNITNGVNYLVICGTTGESVTLSAEEKKSHHTNGYSCQQWPCSFGNRHRGE